MASTILRHRRADDELSARQFVDDGDKVKRGQRLAEWDPYTRPIMTEVEGIVHFEDVVDGLSVLEATDESTGITNSVIIDWRASPRGAAPHARRR